MTHCQYGISALVPQTSFRGGKVLVVQRFSKTNLRQDQHNILVCRQIMPSETAGGKRIEERVEATSTIS